MYSWFWQWNKFGIDEVKTYKTKCVSFLGHPVVSEQHDDL